MRKPAKITSRTKEALPRVAVIGLGEVGSSFSAALKESGVDVFIASLRQSERARSAADRLGLPLQSSCEAALANADIVLLAIVGDALLQAVRRLAPALREDALFVDLTAASPVDIANAAAILPPDQYIDVAINGAVSLRGQKTPLLAAGRRATELAGALNPLGFNIEAKPEWEVGDASKLKLVRSIFTKGLEVVLLEALIAAEAMNIRPALQEALRDYDASTIKQHIDMYLRTHVPMAERRLSEMKKVLALMTAERLPTSIARAAVTRYAQTVRLIDANPPSEGGAEATFAWLFEAETAGAEAQISSSGGGD